MNRGYDGRPIFQSSKDKIFFVTLLEKVVGLCKIRILAYCVMDNHYHLILQDTSEKMSDFFKQLNGQYALYYRKTHGGKGYVFQDRYRSTLIQDDSYLLVAIAYVLNNPVVANQSPSFMQYPWSSGDLYFTSQMSHTVDCEYVEGLFGNQNEFLSFVMAHEIDELPRVKSELGFIVGGEDFIPKALELAERRLGKECMERRRLHDKGFEPFEKVVGEFEKKHDMKIENINVSTRSGKNLRVQLLVHLKERTGLTYREIAQMDLFASLEFSSLSGLYRKARGISIPPRN